ncbi:MAG: GAF domain-containing protein [Deltaproteobacteria bacterium]|nr:GAF domain-containing protein [Deltaproteobacteria bacterium]
MKSLKKIETFYNAFREISRMVHSSTELQEVLELVVWKAAEALNAKGTMLRVLNLDTGELELNSAYGLSEEYLSKRPATQINLITDLYKENRAIVIKDVQHDPRIQYPKEIATEGIQKVIDVPLKFRNQIAGILRICFDTPRDFSKEEIQFLESLAAQCACAIEKVRYIEDQQTKYDQLALHTEKLSALGRMAAGIAHEINNPLAGVLLYSSNLYKKAPAGSPFHEGLGIIIRETKRCKVIIQELLEFSREQEPTKVLSNINDIFEKSYKILENEFKLRHITLARNLADNISPTLLDEGQIEQVFVNLLLNGAQAIDKNGRITIQTLEDSSRKRIVVHISDTGPGIPLEQMGRVFDPFFSTKQDGSGLGLSVSYGIIRNHKGRLNMKNLEEGGCRFTISLPLIQ